MDCRQSSKNANDFLEVQLCPEETERDLPGAVAQARGEVLAGVERVPAGWEAHVLEPALVENASVPVVVPVFPTRQGYPATT